MPAIPPNDLFSMPHVMRAHQKPGEKVMQSTGSVSWDQRRREKRGRWDWKWKNEYLLAHIYVFLNDNIKVKAESQEVRFERADLAGFEKIETYKDLDVVRGRNRAADFENFREGEGW